MIEWGKDPDGNGLDLPTRIGVYGLLALGLVIAAIGWAVIYRIVRAVIG